MQTIDSEIQSFPSQPNLADDRETVSLRGQHPERFRVPRAVAGFTFVIGIVLCWLSHRPVWHTDVWGHLAYGRLIDETGTLPLTEPLMPLSRDVPFVDTAWMSQVIGFRAYERFGIPAIQFLYAASISVCLSLLVWRMYRQTGNVPFCVVGGGLFCWVNWQQLAIVRPQLAGLVCFVLLFVLLSGQTWRRLYWIALPVLFALWANLHGSFPVGLVLLGCFCIGRAGDVFLQSKRFSAVLGDLQFRRYLLLSFTCAGAVLANPYGTGLYREVLTVASHPNLVDLVEWQPLSLNMKQGQAAAVVASGLMIAYWFSPRRISMTEVLLLVGLGAGCLWASRMLLWWATVASYCFVLHGSAVWNRMSDNKYPRQPSAGNSTWTVVTAGLVWTFLALTPLGMSLLYGPRGESASRTSLSALTPIDAVMYLNQFPPKGQIFNSYEWGDYLLWAGPENLDVFVASHAHLIPGDVWRSYLRVIRVKSDWSEILDRYHIDTVVIDFVNQSVLFGELKRHGNLRVAYDDGFAAVFVRQN
ncbi:MAG: hypothetical protein IID46_10095 [Planctomycetes bacterium]|nr:hypothetical protein [Planctomycetota bacterium]